MPALTHTLLPAMSSPRRFNLAAEPETVRPNTFWIFGPFGIEHQLEEKSSIGVYLAALSRNEGANATVEFGPAVEYLRYSHPGARGLGIGFRTVLAGGVALGPSVFYVTRPSKSGVAFRLGASFLFGSNTVPFTPELGIGFRF
jgi:hypothetical protein